MQRRTATEKFETTIPSGDNFAVSRPAPHSNNAGPANGGKLGPVGKPIPRLRVVPREISLHYLVAHALRAFDSHGDVFQLVLPVPLKIFCLRRPDHIKSVTSLKQCGTIKPPGIIPKADYFMGDGVYNDLGGATWFEKRRALAPAFTEAMAMRCSQVLPSSFEKLASRWTKDGIMPIDVYAEIQRLVLDFSAAALFSEQLSPNQLDWIVPATNFAEKMFVTLTPHWLPTPANLRFRRLKRSYSDLMDQIIRNHRRAASSRLDMVGSLMDKPNPATGQPHSDSEIRAEMLSAYLGTPAMALTVLWGVFVLFTRPDILNQLREELKNIIGDRAPRAEDLSTLPYLEMFVKEVLRLYPSFWGSLRYAKEPVEFDGYQFPAKSIFAMIRVAAQRLPDHWDNPNEFIPERHAKRNECPHALLPFGLGPRMCLGRSLAMTVCPLAIALIAQNFDIEFTSHKCGFKYGFGMYPAGPMLATVRCAPG